MIGEVMTGEHADEKDVVCRIRRQFPDDARRTDDWLRERGWEEPDDVPYHWIEAFADRTTDAVRALDWQLVREHTALLAAEFQTGTVAVRSLVDVAYVENVMWDLDAMDKAHAWPYIDEQVRALYVQNWGRQKWMADGCMD